MTLFDTLFLLWGKAGKETEHKKPPYHSALCHMLDVGCVAEALLNSSSACLKEFFFSYLKGPEEQKVLWIAFFVTLHDLGKISPGFQKKRPDLVQCLSKADFPFAVEDEPDHGVVTVETLGDILKQLAQCEKYLGASIACAVGGHHGRFYGQNRTHHGGGQWSEARVEVVEALRKTFGLSWVDFPFEEGCELPAPFLMVLAGLTSVADWIGSDETKFLYTANTIKDLEAYRADRLKVAQKVVQDLHLDDVPLLPGKSDFQAIFHYIEGFIPNACQTITLEILDKLKSPFLMVLETPMGSGKTEAALGVADVSVRERNAAGMYYALPTQATGNQMFRRITEFLENHPAQKNKTELHLLHSHADLDERYEGLKLSSVCGEKKDASVVASTWFTARKRGLISPFAVGTVDQALMAALQSRHMFVRLYGMTGKVVIIDEVHAYDTYTSTVLDRLLNWLGALGASVILLSATLPAKRRQELIFAYAPKVRKLPDVQYPCVIGATRNGDILWKAVEGIKEKTFQLNLICTDKAGRWKAIAERLQTELKDGGCAACFVNTVADAQELFEYLDEQLHFSDSIPTERRLFHARFPLGQRLKIEEEVETFFGKGKRDNPNVNRPQRAIVVATQVLEQSLDVDFDVMVTDLAPIDLILQRAGRLQRHERPRPNHFQNRAVVYCLMPNLEENKADFGASGLIYWPSVLLKTALVLQPKDGQPIRLPQDVEPLMAQVYGPQEIQCPERLTSYLDVCEDEKRLNQAFTVRFAKERLLPQPISEHADSNWLTDLHHNLDDEFSPPAMTRLARPSITIIVIHGRGNQMFLDLPDTPLVDFDRIPDRATIRDLLRCSVILSTPEVVQYFKKQNEPSSWAKAAHLKFCRPAVFRGGVFEGEGFSLVADPKLGIVIKKWKKKLTT